MLPLDKLRSLVKRHEEVEELLCDPAVLTDPRKMNSLNRERSQLVPIVEAMNRFDAIDRRIADDREALDDPELGPIAREEIESLEIERGEVEGRLRILLLPRDPNDDKNTILEIRGGTGGEEAALFAADLFRMYSRYAERRGWRVEILSSSEAAAGGLKELIALVTGDRVYSRLKHEGGVHRVQRVPATEAQGRIHTSAATVAILPEPEDVEIEIRDQDLRIDTYRSSGAGGQHVNKTDSAVRITHLPTGIVVTSSEKSQHQNRARAMKALKVKLYDQQREALDTARSESRKSQVGSGDRSERIRTYNFPQGRVTDHRINLTLYNLPKIMEGEALDDVINPLIAEDQAARLAALEDEFN